MTRREDLDQLEAVSERISVLEEQLDEARYERDMLVLQLVKGGVTWRRAAEAAGFAANSHIANLKEKYRV